MGINAYLDGGRFLADLYAKDSIQGAFQQKIINAINALGKAIGASPVGEIPPPPPVQNINVKASGEMLHVTLDHNATLNRGVEYFVEVSPNDPDFKQPLVVPMGASRASTPIALPSMDDTGTAQQYYVRAYSQYRGGKPSAPVVFGGAFNPASITMKGTTMMTLLSSTGSGTASSNGQQGGQGFGKFFVSAPLPRVGKSSAAADVVATNPTSPSSTAINASATYRPTSNPLTATDAGGSATVSVAGFTQAVAGVGNVAVSSGAITGLSYSTLYYIYYTDPLIQGGAVTFNAVTTKAATINANVNFFVGSILTPASGAPNTMGNNDGGTGAQVGFQANLFAGVAAFPISPSDWTNPGNINDGNFTKYADGKTTVSTEALLSGFSGISPTYASIVLNVKTEIVSNSSVTGAVLAYSLDGGNTWTNIYSLSLTTRPLTTDTVTLSPLQNIGAIQVMLTLLGAGGLPTEAYFYEAWLVCSG